MHTAAYHKTAPDYLCDFIIPSCNSLIFELNELIYNYSYVFKFPDCTIGIISINVLDN